MNVKVTFALIGLACLSPLSIASWLLKRHLQASPPELTPGRLKILKIGVTLGFISCASIVGLFVLFLFWDPPGAGSVEAPNMLLSFLALLGNLCNLLAVVCSAASWNTQGFVAFMLFGANQVLWLILAGEILIAHGF